MSHVFISHSHTDSDFAEVLQLRLEYAGFTVWTDRDIAGGQDWRIDIDQAIRDAFALVAVMTPEASTSEYVTYEWAFAWGVGISVIPVLLKEMELHPRLGTRQYLDFTNRNARPWDALIETLREAEPEPERSGDEGVPQLGAFHEYSGEWKVENHFTRWKGLKLGANATVYWHGRMFLLLSADGKKGSGAQSGKLYVSIDGYRATIENVNWVDRAWVTEDGTLHLDIRVLSRTVIWEEGAPPDPRFREPLPGSGEFRLIMERVPGETKMLKGKHTYRMANEVYQEAEETHEYLGL
jgi:hypothetical protein